MPRRIYSEINLHLTWHTKCSAPVLLPGIEDRLYRYLHHRVVETRGATLHAVGGTETHVHAAVSVPPTLLVSEWVGELKGASAHHINREVARRRLLEWQRGYGVVSFATRDLDSIVRYVLRQKEHHARGTLSELLERCEIND